MRALIVIAGMTVGAVAADLSRRLDRDSVADLEIVHVSAESGDRPAEFVTQHERQRDRPALLIAPHVDVTAADAAGAHFDHDIARLGIGRLGDIPQFDIFVIASVFDERFH